MSGDSILTLIINANWIVQLVMLGLVVSSVVSWACIFRHMKLLRKTVRADRAFDGQFWSGMDITQLYRTQNNSPDPDSGMARIFASGFREFSRLSQQTQLPEAVLEGVQRMMRVALSREQERLEKHVPYLATVGSTAPYVGLFGTVIGVMNAFRGLANVHQTTLAAVAPGIAEALIATAIGLMAAIPAVVAYNRFNSRIEQRLTTYEAFADEFSGILHRKIHMQPTIKNQSQEE